MIKILDEITATLAGSKVSDSSSPSTSSRTTTTIPIPQQQPNEFPPQSVDELIPFNGKIYKFANVVNDGPFSWMVPYLSLIGFKEGNTLVNAIPTKTSSSGDTVIDKETLDALRIKAAEEFTNISPEERQRRNDSGTIAYYITALYAAYSAIILDDGFGLEGHLYKFLVVLPLFMARGLKLSAQYGLWNLAQAGLWDVAGSIEPIDDPELASAFLQKVNDMNFETARDCAIVAGLWSALPYETTYPIAIVGVMGTSLYLLRDKVPKEV